MTGSKGNNARAKREDPQAYFLIAITPAYGRVSTTERVSVFDEGLGNQRRLKIQSSPLREEAIG
jgi:hypothetical protein